MATAVLVLLSPAESRAFPGQTMYEPAELDLGSYRVGSFFGEGTDPDEPLTDGSGSVCIEGGLDPWTLTFTRWYYFWGTGEPVVVRVDGDFDIGMAIYWEDGIWSETPPTPEKLLNCSSWKPRRFQFDSQLGTLYRIQVGDWLHSVPPTLGETPHFLSLHPVTPYGDRDHALPLDLEDSAHMGSWGAPKLEGPGCSVGAAGFTADRSAWGRIDVPLPGTVQVDLEPDREWEDWMVLLYSSGSDKPRSCAVGKKPSLSEYLPEGSYRLQFTRAVQSRQDFEGSVEEGWTVRTDFSIDPDVDKDGYLRPGDCNDRDPSRYPGAKEVVEDSIDQNCDGSDVRRDSDDDAVPDYRDICPFRPTDGIDSNHDGCRDPRQLRLVAQVRLVIQQGRLHVASLLVRTGRGAEVVLACSKQACERASRRKQAKRLRFDGVFVPRVAEGTVITIGASKSGSIGIVKRYRLSSRGVSLLKEWCTRPGKPTEVLACG